MSAAEQNCGGAGRLAVIAGGWQYSSGLPVCVCACVRVCVCACVRVYPPAAPRFLPRALLGCCVAGSVAEYTDAADYQGQGKKASKGAASRGSEPP